MPTAPLRPCAEPRCPTLVVKGRCPVHARGQAQQRPNRDVRKWYYTARWQRLRVQVLSDNPLCVECTKEGRVTVATEVDHITRHEGQAQRFFDRTGIQGLCHRHHGEKTGRGE